MAEQPSHDRPPPSLDEVRRDPFYEKDLAQMAHATNYLKWQFDLIKPYVVGDTLEIGGGIGNFTLRLASVANQLVSVEPNSYCYRQLKAAATGIRNATIVNCVAEELDTHLVACKFDTVVCMNVLEHIADDRNATASFARYLKPGGRLILQVPALNFLFGEIDRRLGHYRRYNKDTTAALFRDCGLIPIQLRYFNFVGVWAWLWNVHVRKAISQSDFQIKVFDKGIVPWLAAVERLVHPPIGQCLLAIGEKPSEL